MRKVAANLSVSDGVVGKLTCKGRCVRQLLTLVSGGVVGKLTCEGRCVRQLLTLVCLVV
jgi:hypothetical protein